MDTEHFDDFEPPQGGDWVRLRTLIALRWLAIAGQVIAVAVAYFLLKIDLRIDLCALAIAASVAFNIVALISNPVGKRLSQLEVTLTLLFDVTQLVVLLYLSGGLSNPFSLLLLAPVTISATALSLPSTIIVGSTAIASITFLVFFNLPLHLIDGTKVHPPALLVFGMWASLVIGILFLGGYARRIAVDSRSMSIALSATQMALAREQQLTALGGVVAAAAHELGTPLATIKLVSSELEDELESRPDLLDDVRLIRSQSERCRDILRDMGRGGRDDSMMKHAPLSAVVYEAAEPHLERGKDVILRIDGLVYDADAPDQPLIPRHPEIIHGLRNFIQNAVDFSKTTVWIDMEWTETQISVTVGDDGLGFPTDMIGRIGDPFVTSKSRSKRTMKRRPNYEGMGLGLFIAKTLLERSGAMITFENAFRTPTNEEDQTPREMAQPSGAIVQVYWKRDGLTSAVDPTREPLGQNVLNRP